MAGLPPKTNSVVLKHGGDDVPWRLRFSDLQKQQPGASKLNRARELPPSKAAPETGRPPARIPRSSQMAADMFLYRD